MGTEATPKQLTAAEAAKAVKRTVFVTEGEGDKARQVEKKVALKADEVLAAKDYGTHVVVVTTDGQKLSSAPEAA